jgi:hypothetical protein
MKIFKHEGHEVHKGGSEDFSLVPLEFFVFKSL